MFSSEGCLVQNVDNFLRNTKFCWGYSSAAQVQGHEFTPVPKKKKEIQSFLKGCKNNCINTETFLHCRFLVYEICEHVHVFLCVLLPDY